MKKILLLALLTITAFNTVFADHHKESTGKTATLESQSSLLILCDDRQKRY